MPSSDRTTAAGGDNADDNGDDDDDAGCGDGKTVTVGRHERQWVPGSWLLLPWT